MSQDTITGSHIAGRYHVTGYLRAGRMGDVYVARRLDNNERVAIKLLDPALFSEPEAVKRFQQECMITSTIKHPCSLEVLDYGRSEHGHLFMVTDYVVGDLLTDAIEESGAMAPERAAWIAAQIAMALAAAHEIGVIHRDLSPKNVLIAEADGQQDLVKVLEFGLSRMTTESSSDGGLTAVGVRIGTPTYMAPEYIEEYALDHRADLYSLGIVLYEMLVGEAPFTGRPYKVMDMHMHMDVPPPSSKVEAVPSWLDEVVAALTQKSPDARIQTANEVVERIEAGLGRELKPVEVAAPAPEPEPEPTSEEPGHDPILLHFIEEQLGRVSKSASSRPDLRRCLVVDRVAEPSIASRLGVEAGYLLELPDEDLSGELEHRLYRHMVDSRRYRFHTPDGEAIEVSLTGIEPGAEYMRTAENVATWYTADSDPEALVEVWKQRRWDVLDRLAMRNLSQQKGTVGVLNTGLFAKFLGRGEIKVRNHPALLFHGAAMIEQGDGPGGLALVNEYRTHFARSWAPIYSAVAHFYLAMDKARAGKDDLAVDLLLESLALHQFARTHSAIEKMVGRRATVDSHLGDRFPDYSLDTVDRRHNLRLRDTLRSMDASQVMIVCMLGGYRGNPAYDDFMHRYLSLAAWFPDFIADLHVITTVTSRDVDKEDHYTGEDVVVRAKVPFLVLEDYRAFVQRAVKPTRIPTIYVLNKQGVVVHEGELSTCDWWEALALAGKLRLQAFARDQ